MRAHAITNTWPRSAWRRTPLLIVLSVCALAIPATANAQAGTSADTVRDWNRFATAAIANARRRPSCPASASRRT